jgi:outer membrane assembly lipoprotein YfiO
MALGARAVQEGDCYEARQLLSGYLEREPSGEKADEAHNLLGVCAFRNKEWPSAATEFLIVVNQFAGSARVPDARYHLAVAYWRQARGSAYDQDYTHRALAEFERFLELYPDHPRAEEIRSLRADALGRLARKDYENGRLYLKMGYLSPARFYFRSVQSAYPGTSWARLAALGEARSWEREKRCADAIPILERLLAESPEPDVAAEARQLLDACRRATRQSATR